MDTLSLLQKIAIWALPIIFAMTIHEVAHGWVASYFGDQTARLNGRLTLNPLKHIDVIGTLIVPTLMIILGGFIFGWAKPVPVDYRNLKNPKWNSIWVAIAGPFANLGMALIWALLLKFSFEFPKSNSTLWLAYTSQAGIAINLFVMLFNLLPIPPLDGSVIVSSFLKGKTLYYFDKIRDFGFLILLLLVSTQVLKCHFNACISKFV